MQVTVNLADEKKVLLTTFGKSDRAVLAAFRQAMEDLGIPPHPGGKCPRRMAALAASTTGWSRRAPATCSGSTASSDLTRKARLPPAGLARATTHTTPCRPHRRR